MTKTVGIILESGIGKVPSESGEREKTSTGDSARVPKIVLLYAFVVAKGAPHVAIHSTPDIHRVREKRFIEGLGRSAHQTLGDGLHFLETLGARSYHVKAKTAKFVPFHLR